jgi:hypothetical protein
MLEEHVAKGAVGDNMGASSEIVSETIPGVCFKFLSPSSIYG